MNLWRAFTKSIYAHGLFTPIKAVGTEQVAVLQLEVRQTSRPLFVPVTALYNKQQEK